jgi:hypothetical protein
VAAPYSALRNPSAPARHALLIERRVAVNAIDDLQDSPFRYAGAQSPVQIVHRKNASCTISRQQARTLRYLPQVVRRGSDEGLRISV